jgi:hypothetical protein
VNQQEGGCGKERISRGEEDGCMLPMQICRLHNEARTKNLKIGGAHRGRMEEMNLYKVHFTHVINYHNEIALHY